MRKAVKSNKQSLAASTFNGCLLPQERGRRDAAKMRQGGEESLWLEAAERNSTKGGGNGECMCVCVCVVLNRKAK
jgi:hypothetical protein